MEKDVFISYSSKDQAAKDEICSIFDKAGISYWLDTRDFELGKDISQNIVNQLRKSRFTLLIVSMDSLFSPWVGFEAMFRLMEDYIGNTDRLICAMTDTSVLEVDFPVRMQEQFNQMRTQLEILRTTMLGLGGHPGVYDIEIERLSRINVGQLMKNVRSRLGIDLANVRDKESNIQKLVSRIKDTPPMHHIGLPKGVDNFNSEELMKAIVNDEAILFLGPEVSVNFDNGKNQDSFFNQLAIANGDGNLTDIRCYHEQDGLLVIDGGKLGKLAHQQHIRNFFKREIKNDTLEKLAQIPFPVIVNTALDRNYARICDDRKIFFTEEHSGKTTPITPKVPISGHHPLVYNLLGSVEDAQSLVVTHDDLFELLMKMEKSPILKDVINAIFPIDRRIHLVFIGFDFNKWYFQLILKILNIEGEPFAKQSNNKAITTDLNSSTIKRRPLAKHATNQWQMYPPSKKLYQSHFKITFVRSDIPHFVDCLHNLFDPNQLRWP